MFHQSRLGIVTLLEIDGNPLGNLRSQAAAVSSLHCRNAWPRNSFMVRTGGKVAINVEEVIDGGMNIQKALSRSRRLEALLFLLASADRQMRVLTPIIPKQALLARRVRTTIGVLVHARSVAPGASARQRDNASAVAFARAGGQANAHSHTDYSAASASYSAAAAHHLGTPLKSEPLDATAMNDCQNEDAAGRSS